MKNNLRFLENIDEVVVVLSYRDRELGVLIETDDFSVGAVEVEPYEHADLIYNKG